VPPRAVKVSTHVIREESALSLEARVERNAHNPAVIWLTGLPSAGKSTIGRKLESALFALGCQTALLDGDNLRHGLCKDLGFSDKDRTENIRRVGEVARLFFDHGAIVICTFISPSRDQRNQARNLVPAGHFFEIFVRCSLKTCMQRDPKGHYKKAIEGKIPEFTGISAPYEEPLNPEFVADTEKQKADEIAQAIIYKLRDKGIVAEHGYF